MTEYEAADIVIMKIYLEELRLIIKHCDKRDIKFYDKQIKHYQSKILHAAREQWEEETKK